MAEPILISFIVCAYNVEEFIERCLESLVTQTYTNIQIVVVNDGSTDSTGAICAAWAAKDPRIKIVKQSNQGPGTARLQGIKEAQGEYLLFVDADDWISEDTISANLELVRVHNADLILFNHYDEFQSKTQKNVMFPCEGAQSQAAILTLLFKGELPWNCWGLFIKRSLVVKEDFVFPLGRNNAEDLAITTQVVGNAEHPFFNSQCYYHYRRRDDSLSAVENRFSTIDKLVKNGEDSVEIKTEIVGQYIIRRYPSLTKLWIRSTANTCFIYLMAIARARTKNKRALQLRNRIESFYAEHMMQLLQEDTGTKLKTLIVMLKLSRTYRIASMYWEKTEVHNHLQ